jgi:hypothetical protein
VKTPTLDEQPTAAADAPKAPDPFLAGLTSVCEFLLVGWTAGLCFYAGALLFETGSQLPALVRIISYLMVAALACSMLLLCTPRWILPVIWLGSPRRRRLTIGILPAIIGGPTLALAVIETCQEGWALDTWTLAYPAGPGLMMVLAIRWWGETGDSLKARWFRLLLPIVSTVLWNITCLVVGYVCAGGPRLR